MEVIGIVQTDLNEFNILFQESQQQDKQKGNQKDKNKNSGDGGQSGGGMDMGFFSFLGGDDTQEENQQSGHQGGGGQGGGGKDGSSQGDKSQEMTVRIKGIPEGDKATFLQMYQLINDAKESKELEQKLTVLSRGGDEQNGGGSGGEKKKKEGGAGRSGGTRSMSQSKGS
ncbi:hypothetical protein [Brevibacillus dissolubilis]|uniref:hypothetical protein n=1 Tax=Brevibacillus dissolubilis TaxID=1844116 RepID=UPI0011168447|nr:hypothetical protein [Brevibacillus dissolubilis]